MTNESNLPQQALDARVKQKLNAMGSVPAEFEPEEAQRAGAFVEDALSGETAEDVADTPTFVEDGQTLDVPLHITRTNARELFGKHPGESVSDALDRLGRNEG